jgi:hypothetical protein
MFAQRLLHDHVVIYGLAFVLEKAETLAVNQVGNGVLGRKTRLKRHP